jgi:hypothetical protein
MHDCGRLAVATLRVPFVQMTEIVVPGQGEPIRVCRQHAQSEPSKFRGATVTWDQADVPN